MQRLETSEVDIHKRYETFLNLYENQFKEGLEERYRRSIYLSKELLHCAIKAYFDDIAKYKAYAGSDFADRHKQAAYSIKWLSRFKPIQLLPEVEPDTVLLTINEAFALYAGLIFLEPTVIKGISQKFYKHLIYTITYRNLSGKGLATLMYLLECGIKNGGQV